MDKKTQLVVGGSLEKALQGDYQLNVKDVFTEAWQLTQGNKWNILQGLLFMFSLAMILLIVTANVLEGYGLNLFEDAQLQGFAELVLSILFAPLTTGIVMMGVNHAVGGKSNTSHLFHFLPKSAILALTALIANLLINIGLSLLIIPGLYLAMASTFAQPLVVEKGLTPLRAIMTSIRVVTHRWYQFAMIYGIFLILFLLVIATFGIAAFWVAPLYYHVKGVLYRDVFGVRITLKGPGEDESESSEGVFNA